MQISFWLADESDCQKLIGIDLVLVMSDCFVDWKGGLTSAAASIMIMYTLILLSLSSCRPSEIVWGPSSQTIELKSNVGTTAVVCRCHDSSDSVKTIVSEANFRGISPIRPRASDDSDRIPKRISILHGLGGSCNDGGVCCIVLRTFSRP